MTDNSITQFDPNALKQRISESVQNTFGMLIPKEKFDQMIEAEVKAYFETEQKLILKEEEQRRNSYGSSDTWSIVYAKMTPFRRQVWDAVATEVKDLIKAKLQGPEFKALIAGTWESEKREANKETVLSDLIERKLNELAPQMAAHLFRDMFVSVTDSAKNQVLCEVSEIVERRLGNR